MPKVFDPESGLQEIAKWLRSVSRPSLVAIAGMTCSGKSTLAEKVESEFSGKSLIVPLDDFFREADDRQLPRDSQGKMLFDLPESYDIPEFVGVMNRLLGGHEATLPYFDKPTARRVREKSRAVSPQPIIIAEGLFAVSFLKHQKTNRLLVYVKADPDTCLQRRIDRDVPIFGTSADKVRNNFAGKVVPYLKYLQPQERDADMVINTD